MSRRKSRDSDVSSEDEEYQSQASSEEDATFQEESSSDEQVEFLEEDLGTVWDGMARKSSRKKRIVEKLSFQDRSRSKKKGPHRGFSEGDYVPERSLRQRKSTNYLEDGDETPLQEEIEEIGSTQESSNGKAQTTSQSSSQPVVDSDPDAMDEEEPEEKPKKKPKAKKKKVFESAETLEIEDDEEEEEEEEIERILACKEVDVQADESQEVKEGETPLMKKEVQYLIKFKEKSYLHCEWMNRADVESIGTGADKVKRFDKKFTPQNFIDMGEDDYFPEDYTVVDRILDDVLWNKKRCFLIKWKGLPYNELNWEFEENLHEAKKIAHYEKYKLPPCEEERMIPTRPAPRAWKKLEESPKFKGVNQLREYQLEGLNWLLFCWYNKRNSCLADEMGLGKTIQAVSILETLRANYGYRGPFLVIVPLSTISHWQREFESWTELNVIVFHGTAEARLKLMDYEFYWYDKRKKPFPGLWKFNVMITTYETILSEAQILGKIPWQYMIVDEGHRLKNKNSKLLEVLRTFKVGHKLLLTGTPIQNDIGELWSLLNFVEPSKFNDLEGFLEEYGILKDATKAKELHDVIEPYLLRRLKEDVEKSIPPKEEIIVEVVPTKDQKKYYRAILDRNREFLERGASKKNVPNLVNILMEIRKICNHPFLLKGVEQELIKNCPPEQQANLLINASSKMIIVDKLLHRLREGKHKVLIFSQFVMMLNILEDYLHIRGWPYERLDGSIRGDERQASIDRFSDPNKDNFVFLVSTRAGGVGINLTSADTVIIFDSDFNPQNDLQAQARVHRIGQTKDVKIYRLLTKDTKEKEIFQKASMKLGLDRAVLNMESNDFDGGGKKVGLNVEEVDTLLKHGAYAAYKKDTTEDEKLLESDIDTIMARSSTVMRYDQEISEKGVSQFSKASFSFDEKDGVDVNDKDFWNKVFPENKTPEGLLKKLTSETNLETPEERASFLNDVENLVGEKVSQFQKYVHTSTDSLSDLLVQIAYSTRFDETQRARFKELQNQISGRRGGRAKDERGIGESDDEGYDSGQGAPTEKNKSGWSRKGGWYKAERARFQRGLLELGWGRWTELQENYRVPSHTLDDVQSFAENFCVALKQYCDEEDKEFLEELIVSDGIEVPKAKDIKPLVIAPTNNIDVVTPITVTLPEQVACKLFIIHDGQIIREVAVTGDNATPLIVAPGWCGEFTIRCVIGKSTYESAVFLTKGSHHLYEETEWLSNAKNGAVMWIRKLHFTNNLKEVMEKYNGKLETKHIPGIAIKKPAEWWDSECDRDVLIGYRNEGFGRLEFKTDENYCIKKKFETFCESIKNVRDKQTAIDEFPSLSTINKRAQKLVEKILKIPTRKVEKKEKVKESPGSSQPSSQTLKRSSIVEGWSKREKQDICKVLGTWGKCPDEKGESRWDLVISRGKLRKSEEACTEYFARLMEVCEKFNADPDQSDELKEFELAPQTAKKLYEKIVISDNVSKVVFQNYSNLESRLKYLKNWGQNLPKWWKIEHDLALLEGVKVHGMEFKKTFEEPLFASQVKGIPRESVCCLRLENICELWTKLDSIKGDPEEEMKTWAPHRTVPTQTKNLPRNTKKLDDSIDEEVEVVETYNVIDVDDAQPDGDKSKITGFMKRKREEDSPPVKKMKDE